MNENDPIEQLKAIEQKNVSQACDCLRGYEQEIGNHLAHFVASLCDIDIEDMFSNMKNNYYSQARWLYWYALRYMTDETYDKIATRTIYNGHKFTLRAVAKGIDKMGKMVYENGIWRKRWIILKKIIKMYNGDDEQDVIKVVITKPANTKVEVEFKNE